MRSLRPLAVIGAAVLLMAGAFWAIRLEARRSAELRDLRGRIESVGRKAETDRVRRRVLQVEQTLQPTSVEAVEDDTETAGNMPFVAEAQTKTDDEGPSDSELIVERQAQFASQGRDGPWAVETQRTLAERLEQLLARSQIGEIDCRATTCKVTLRFETREQYMSFVDSNLIHTVDTLWRGAFAFHIEETSTSGITAVGFFDAS